MAERPDDACLGEAFAALDAATAAERTRGPVGLAVSGGGDSVALLHIADKWARTRGAALEVATVDHRLRPESAAEAIAVAKAANALGWRHETLEWRGWAGKGNLQAEARA
ncbi:MAG: ATP-binding protein, partial [Paracoccaceae bacterium]